MSKITQGKTTLFLDQYGEPVWAKSRKELKAKVGSGKVSLMFNDRPEGTVICGYVIGQRWFSAYRPIAIKAE